MKNSIFIFLLFSCMLNIVAASVNITTETPIKIEFTITNDTASNKNESKITSTLDTNFEDELTSKNETDVVTNSLEIPESENEPVIEPLDIEGPNYSEKNEETSIAPKPEAEPEQTSIIPEPEAKPEQTTEEEIETTTITIIAYKAKSDPESEHQTES